MPLLALEKHKYIERPLVAAILAMNRKAQIHSSTQNRALVSKLTVRILKTQIQTTMTQPTRLPKTAAMATLAVAVWATTITYRTTVATPS